MHDSRWLRAQAENLIREVFDAARTKGPQVVDDHDGDFEIVFRPKKKDAGAALFETWASH
jgi:hypothetical protein